MASYLRRIFITVFCIFAACGYGKVWAVGGDAENIYREVNGSIFTVFGIESEGKKGVVLGSAVAVENSVLATNCHVALSGNFLVVYVGDFPKLGRLYYYNRANDLCLVEVLGIRFNPVKIRASGSVNIGEKVFAIGNPEGMEKTISEGIVSNKHIKNGKIILQTDAAISHGSSGGGLFDTDGNLVGITTSKLTGGENIGFAIGTELILSVIHTTESTKNIDHAQEQNESSKNNKSLPSENNTTKNNNQKTTLVQYRAEITNDDRFNSKNIRLDNIRDILRQDRANHYLYPTKSTKLDDSEKFFDDVNNRNIFETASIKIDHLLENKILNGNQSVLISVYVYSVNQIEVIEIKRPRQE